MGSDISVAACIDRTGEKAGLGEQRRSQKWDLIRPGDSQVLPWEEGRGQHGSC